MKKTMMSFGMFTLLALAIASCKKKDDTAVTPGGGTGTGTGVDSTATATSYPDTITASNYGFDGTAGTAFSSTDTSGIVMTGTTMSIKAVKNGTTEAITIVLTGITDTGTYDLDKGNTAGNSAVITKDHTQPANAALNYKTEGNEAVTNNIGGGKVYITSLSTTAVKGTFYIIAYNGAGSPAFAEQGKITGKIKK